MTIAAARKDDKAEPLQGFPLPGDIAKQIDRGRTDMRKDADIRRQAVKFFQNEPYWYVKATGGLGVLPTALDAVDKASYRIRRKFNLIPMMVQRKVSAATQRIPGYEVSPTSTDPDHIAGAHLSQQVAFYGYDKWRMRRMTTKALTNAIVQREALVMPYFDQNVGPFHKKRDGSYEGEGDIKFLVLSRGEVIWEPGLDYEESPWFATVRAVLPEKIKQIPGFMGGDPPLNAVSADLPEGKSSDQMCELIEFYERPCPDYPEGRKFYITSNKIVVDNRKVDPKSEYPWEDYPYRDENDKVIDEPLLHRISYTTDPEGDDKGLVEVLIDPQLTVIDCWNKILEMKNRALMLQMIAPKGSNLPPRDDRPGAVAYYNPVGGQPPQWEPAPDPQYLAQLREILEAAKAEMRAMAGDIDFQPEPDLAAKTLNASIEQAQAQWQVFLGDIAEFHSRVMRHCLVLVARHYSRERIIEIRGQYGWEPVKAFTGVDLNSQVNVRVLPGSIESKTSSAVRDELAFVQTYWPGSISPEVAVAAMRGGNPEGLMQSYVQHVARAWRLVQAIRENPDAVLNSKPRQDLNYGDPMHDFMVPGWMPRPQDNLVIWKQVIADYMITPDYDTQPEEVQAMFNVVWDGLEHIEQMKLMQIQAQTESVAETQGAANAASPQGDIALPTPQAGLQSPQQASPSAMTPE